MLILITYVTITTIQKYLGLVQGLSLSPPNTKRPQTFIKKAPHPLGDFI